MRSSRWHDPELGKAQLPQRNGDEQTHSPGINTPGSGSSYSACASVNASVEVRRRACAVERQSVPRCKCSAPPEDLADLQAARPRGPPEQLKTAKAADRRTRTSYRQINPGTRGRHQENFSNTRDLRVARNSSRGLVLSAVGVTPKTLCLGDEARATGASNVL